MKTEILANVAGSTPALIALSTFLLAYCLVIFEEFIQLRKSKPLVLASGIIWVIVAYIAEQKGLSEVATTAIRHNITEYAELLLFIIVAITYINVLTERKVFDALRSWLVAKGYSYRQLFWLTGILTFFLSPLADNLTTALAMSAVILAVGKDNPRFAGISCISVVVAANAGGAFSPFGDLTTLMVWQANLIPFTKFFKLFLPAIINYLIPALCLSFALPKGKPKALKERIPLSSGGKRVILLFLLTIGITVYLQHQFQLPPAIGMMVGLGLLQFFAYYTQHRKNLRTLEIFPAIKELDWDTLLFFYGVILAVGGLATLGYLGILSNTLYGGLGGGGADIGVGAAGEAMQSSFMRLADHSHTLGNIMIGLLSAIVDNIPLMFAVITMNPAMSEGQWLLLTLTAGVGGSLLSIGSAAGVGVMGQARGIYTFFTHLKWIWAIFLGYAGSIACHLWLNASLF